MELVYLYVQEAYSEEYDLHLDFSNNIKIRFNKQEGKFSVENLDNRYSSNFFGSNVKNITVLMGENGVGKSTIIHILSLLQKIRDGFDEYKWLIIYRDEASFYLEGNVREGIQINSCSKHEYLIQGFFENGKFVQKHDSNFTHGKSVNLKYIIPYTIEKEFPRELHGYVYRDLIEKSLLTDKFYYLASPDVQKVFSINAQRKLQITLQKPKDITNYKKMGAAVGSGLNADKLKALSEFSEKIYKKKTKFSMPVKKYNCIDNKEDFILFLYWLIFDSLIGFLIHININRPELLPGVTVRVNDLLKSFPTNVALENSGDRSYCREYFNHSITNMISFIGDLPNDFPINNVPNTYDKVDISMFMESIGRLDEKYFLSSVHMEITGEEFFEYEGEIRAILTGIDLFQNKYSILNLSSMAKDSTIRVSFGDLSAGEEQLIETFSQINSRLKAFENNGEEQVFILLLDEYEKYLHPEWARKFLFFLVRLLNVVPKNYSFQVVLTSHSPYLVSDLPKENIRLITKDEKTEKREVSIPKHSFASNYYDILSDSFFLEDTIGEFAKQKIQGWIQSLNEIASLEIPIKEKLAKVEQIRSCITIIDDPFMRQKLDELAEDIYQKLISTCNKLQKMEILKQREQALEDELKRIKEELSND